MEITVGASFEPLLYDRHRYLVLCGGAGSGKSEFAGRKVFYRCMAEGRHRYLILRKVRNTLAGSVVRVMRAILAENGVVHQYNKTDKTISFAGPRGANELIFAGLDDPEKIKSIKGITSMWMEEATEFSKSDFLQIDLRLREPGPAYHQIMLSFNPDEVVGPWLKEMFFDAANPDALVHRSTIADNPIEAVRGPYTKQLEALKAQDEAMYQIYALGLWAARSGQVFSWDVRPLPRIAFDEVWYGGDFGYSVDPAALVKIYRRADELWLQEVFYERGLTNPDIDRLARSLGVDRSKVSYWDSAEQKSIEELRRMGWYARPAEKGPDSVRAGIDYMKAMKIHIVEGSTNLVEEAGCYCWRKDKAGRSLPEPVAFKNHLIDASRYGIVSHLRHAGVYVGTLPYDVFGEA